MSTRAHVLAAVLAVLLPAAPALAQEPVSEETVSYFRTNCSSCHTIGGGPLAGPDLKDVSRRRTRAQLVKFMADPKAAIDAGDAYLAKLLADARGVYMPPPPNLTSERSEKLLDLIDAESALEKSRFAGMTLSDRPLTVVDVERGRAIFDGTQPTAAGGPACLGCHSVSGLGGFGGGRLGPDLTDAFARLGGRKALAAWLSSPQSPTMAPAFAGRPLGDDEILALVAYLQDRAVAPGRGGGAGLYSFLAVAAGLLVAALAAFDFAWRGRFRGVRRSMVEGARR